jgi:hypothetical protein
MTNDNILEIINQLSKKVEILEKEILLLKSNNPISNRKRNIIEVLQESDNIPTITFEEWIQSFRIEKYHIQNVFEHGILSGFQKCVSCNISICEGKLPIYSFTNSMYIYNQNHNWTILSEEHIHKLITNVYRKMLQIHLNSEPDLSIHEDVRDINMKCLSEMRMRLFKQKRKIIQWLYHQFA